MKVFILIFVLLLAVFTANAQVRLLQMDGTTYYITENGVYKHTLIFLQEGDSLSVFTQNHNFIFQWSKLKLPKGSEVTSDFFSSYELRFFRDSAGIYRIVEIKKPKRILN